MKKYRNILIITYLFLLVIGLTNKTLFNMIPKVSLTTLQNEDIVTSLNCTGEVIIEQYGIFSSVSTDIEEVYVSVGDTVEENELLAKTRKSDESIAVMAGVESYRNKLYNDYLAVLSQTLSDLGIDGFASDLSIPVLNEYKYMVQDSDKVSAPVNGTVTSINSNGKAVELGIEPMIVITDYDDVSVACKVPEEAVNTIKIGQDVKITGSALKHSYSGRVEEISQNVNTSLSLNSKGTVDVLIDVINPDDKLLSGLTASCKIITDIQRSAKVLPTECIYQNDLGEEFVMVYNNGVVKYKNVECDYYSSENVKVQGINSDDYVIVNSDILPENSKVLLEVA